MRLRLVRKVVPVYESVFRSKRRLVRKSSHTRITQPSQCSGQVHESRERRSTKMQNLRRLTLVACLQGLVRMSRRHAPLMDASIVYRLCRWRSAGMV